MDLKTPIFLNGKGWCGPIVASACRKELLLEETKNQEMLEGGGRCIFHLSLTLVSCFL